MPRSLYIVSAPISMVCGISILKLLQKTIAVLMGYPRSFRNWCSGSLRWANIVTSMGKDIRGYDLLELDESSKVFYIVYFKHVEILQLGVYSFFGALGSSLFILKYSVSIVFCDFARCATSCRLSVSLNRTMCIPGRCTCICTTGGDIEYNGKRYNL